LPGGLSAASPRLDRSADRQALEAAGDRLAQLFDLEHGIDKDNEPEAALCASAISGREPPAGPQWRRGLSPLLPSALAYAKPLCASLDGFTLQAAIRAGAHHLARRRTACVRAFGRGHRP
jgi:hypothetical protein